MATSSVAPTGADFDNVFGGNIRNGGVSDRQRDRLVREEHERLKGQRWENVTVLNLHTFPLSVNLGELGLLEVPTAVDGAPGRLFLDRYRLSMRDLGDGNFTPVSVLPAEMGREIEREYGPTGGVLVYSGEGEPPAGQLEEARAKQQAWWRRLYQEAVDSWARYHQHKMLTDRQRDAARALFGLGEIAELPEWVTLTRAQADRRDCPMCAESIKVTAKICHFCRTKLAVSSEQ